MTDTHGGHFSPPTLECSDCGRKGGRFSKVKGEWLCDECVEMDEIMSEYRYPNVNLNKPFNPPRFVWARPTRKEIMPDENA